MTGPVERVPLTDERLVQWASNPAYYTTRETVRTLIAELRASRAREQAQRTLREHAERMKVELRDQRDELQQRIDKALAACQAAELSGWGSPDRNQLIDDVRAALTGTETTDA